MLGEELAKLAQSIIAACLEIMSDIARIHSFAADGVPSWVTH